MSGLLELLRAEQNRMNPKDRRLVDYILQNPSSVVGMSITELAETTEISAATISRFCKAYRFANFSDFKIKLSAELAQVHTENNQSYQDIVQGNSLDRIVSAIEANHLRSIADTTRLLDLKQMSRALDALETASHIDLYGVATSGVVAQDFYQKLIRIGKRCTAFSDPHMQITSASNLVPGDVALAITYSGETPEIIDALSCAKEQGAVTIALTKFGPNTVSQMVDIPLFASTLEEGVRRGAMASRIAQLHVIDILFMGLVSKQFGDYVPRLEQSYQMVKKYRTERTDRER